MIQLEQIQNAQLASDPYQWAFVGNLFQAHDAKALAATYPHDHYKTLRGNDGEKSYFYDCRSLVGMGQDGPMYPEELAPQWKAFVDDLLSPGYRRAMSDLVGRDLMGMAMEANLFHYGPGTWMGPHVDLATKIITHVFYFNDGWNDEGGGLAVLRSSDMNDRADYIAPLVGNSVVLVRSDDSWHAVTPITKESPTSRRSLTVTFYAPGSPSTMWPAGEKPELHVFDGQSHDIAPLQPQNGAPGLGSLKRLAKRVLGK